MPVAALEISTGEFPGVEELGGAPPLMGNLLTEMITKSVRSRPGVSTWADFPAVVPNASPVIGMYPWGANFLVYVTKDRKVWAWTSAGSVLALSDTTSATQLAGSLRPVFSECKALSTPRVVITGGGAPLKWTGAGLCAVLGGSPPAASHVAAIADRLVVNNYDLSGQFTFTDAASGSTPDPFESTWVNILEAEAKPDPLVAVADNTRELFAFGTRTLQCYVPDAATKFAVARTLNVGCGAAYSIVPIDDGFGWLDDHRRFVQSNARGMQAISSPAVDRVLSQIGTTSDCWGFRARIDAFDMWTWMFPTDRRGFCYEANTKSWSEWRSYLNGDWTAPYIQSYAYWPERNLHLVGLSDGTIGQLDMTVAAEGSQVMKSDLLLGFEDHGTTFRKQCYAVQFSMRRGMTAANATEPSVELSWRDDLGGFEQPMRQGLGLAGDYETVLSFRSLGVYRTRQWRITASDTHPLIIGKVMEHFENLEV